MGEKMPKNFFIKNIPSISLKLSKKKISKNKLQYKLVSERLKFEYCIGTQDVKINAKQLFEVIIKQYNP